MILVFGAFILSGQQITRRVRPRPGRRGPARRVPPANPARPRPHAPGRPRELVAARLAGPPPPAPVHRARHPATRPAQPGARDGGRTPPGTQRQEAGLACPANWQSYPGRDRPGYPPSRAGPAVNAWRARSGPCAAPARPTCHTRARRRPTPPYQRARRHRRSCRIPLLTRRWISHPVSSSTSTAASVLAPPSAEKRHGTRGLRL